MELKEILLTILSLLASTFVVIVFIAIGWYIVWVAFLSRFKLMRELLSIGESEKEKETVPPASKSSTRSRRGKQTKDR